MNFPKWFVRLAAPKYAYALSGVLVRVLSLPALCLLLYGLWGGLYAAPADYQQGDGFRIIYVHVPCAFLSLGIYTAMAAFAALGFIWRIKLYDYLIIASAPVGALMTALALVTGAIWGKPMWGTFWVWDARLTSELFQLFLYIGVIALQNAVEESQQSDALVRLLVLVGFVNIPIIHFSVYWWNTLHQGQTIKFFGGPSLIAPSMLHPLLVMIIAFSLCASILIILRMRNTILQKEFYSHWVLELKRI